MQWHFALENFSNRDSLVNGTSHGLEYNGVVAIILCIE